MPKNIYICGLPRGGTTFATLAIGSHPDAYPMGETMYLAQTDPKNRACSCGVVGCSHAVAIYEQARRSDRAHDLYHAYGALDVTREPHKIPSADTIRYRPPDTPVAMERLLQNRAEGVMAIAGIYRDLYGERAFVDNTKEAEFGRRLSQDDWVPVVVTRDLRGVAHSVLQAASRKNVARDLSDKVESWRAFLTIASSLTESGAPHIQYEQLASGAPNALRLLQAVSDQAGLSSYTENDLSRGYEHHMLHGNRMALHWNGLSMADTADESWRGAKGLSVENQTFIAEVIPEYFETFGYELV